MDHGMDNELRMPINGGNNGDVENTGIGSDADFVQTLKEAMQNDLRRHMLHLNRMTLFNKEAFNNPEKNEFSNTRLAGKLQKIYNSFNTEWEKIGQMHNKRVVQQYFLNKDYLKCLSSSPSRGDLDYEISHC